MRSPIGRISKEYGRLGREFSSPYEYTDLKGEEKENVPPSRASGGQN